MRCPVCDHKLPSENSDTCPSCKSVFGTGTSKTPPEPSPVDQPQEKDDFDQFLDDLSKDIYESTGLEFSPLEGREESTSKKPEPGVPVQPPKTPEGKPEKRTAGKKVADKKSVPIKPSPKKTALVKTPEEIPTEQPKAAPATAVKPAAKKQAVKTKPAVKPSAAKKTAKVPKTTAVPKRKKVPAAAPKSDETKRAVKKPPETVSPAPDSDDDKFWEELIQQPGETIRAQPKPKEDIPTKRSGFPFVLSGVVVLVSVGVAFWVLGGMDLFKKELLPADVGSIRELAKVEGPQVGSQENTDSAGKTAHGEGAESVKADKSTDVETVQPDEETVSPPVTAPPIDQERAESEPEVLTPDEEEPVSPKEPSAADVEKKTETAPPFQKDDQAAGTAQDEKVDKPQEPGDKLPDTAKTVSVESIVSEPSEQVVESAAEPPDGPAGYWYEDVESGESYFTIQVASLRTEAAAKQKLEGFRSKGYPAYVVEKSDPKVKFRYKLRIGKYPSRPEAETAAATFQQKEKQDFMIVTSRIRTLL